jgi:hypothetical protein
MGYTPLTVEVMDTSYSWQDLTTYCRGIAIDGLGLTYARGVHARVANARMTFDNSDQRFNPALSGIGTGVLDNRRRVRVRAGGPSLGKLAQLIYAGPSGLGATTSIVASGTNLPIGNQGGTSYQQAQSFMVTAGELTQITFRLGPTTGAPTGTMTWEMLDNDTSTGTAQPGSVLQTGTLAPTASATNTISGLTGLAMTATPKYWLKLYSTGAQAPGNYWTWQAQLTSVYASGNMSQSTDGGATWIDQPTSDATCSIRTSLIGCFLGQSKVQAVVATDVISVTYEARAQFDSQHNTVAVRVGTNAESAFTSATYSNKWASYTATFTATAIGASVFVRFYPQLSGAGLNSKSIEIRNVTLTLNGGANLLTNGSFASGALSPWAVTNAASTSSSITASVTPDYWILFNGLIEDIQPAPFFNGGLRTCDVLAVDFTEVIRLQRNLNLALAKNQTADQLITTLMAARPAGTLHRTLPGSQIETGLQTFQTAFDGYTNEDTAILDAINDTATSDGGRMWLDRDGTFRYVTRDFVARQVVVTPALSFTNAAGMNYMMVVDHPTDTVINSVNLTWHPRQTLGALSAIGQITSPLEIPPVQPFGTPGETTITLSYRDPATGKACGGDSMVLPLVASTDYLINDVSDGSGFDYTSSPSFTLEVISSNASQIVITLRNTATGPLYATRLQVRGYPVVSYDPQTISDSDTTSIETYDERSFKKDLPFSNDVNFAKSLAQYLISRRAYPFVEVKQIEIQNKATLGGVDLLGLELMDVIDVTDTQSGLTAMKHMITGVEYVLDPQSQDYVKSVKLIPERLDDVTYWILGDATYGVLDSTTRLYI